MPGIGRNPSHRRHATGMGRVTLSGRDHYTGRWGTPEAEAEYRRLVMEWNGNGRRAGPGKAGPTVGWIVAAYLEWAERRYRKRGEVTSHVRGLRIALGALASAHASTPADEFGPRSLRALRASWLAAGPGGRGPLARRTAARYAGMVVGMYLWAVAEEMIPPDLHARLDALGPLTEHDGGSNPPARLSADPEAVKDALPLLPAVVADIVRVMLLTGMRRAEACTMNVRDLDRSEAVWIYRVAADWNKTEHKGRRRVVFLGPKAQAVLGPRIAEAGKDGWIFRPTRGNRKGHYLPKSLTKVLDQSLKANGVEHWSVGQLRHNSLTAIHTALGLETARGVAGHSSSRTTMVYLDPDAATAEDRAAARAAALALG